MNNVIPFNFYYNLNIGSATPISGNRYVLRQIVIHEMIDIY